MTLPNTENLNIPARGLPTEYLYSLSSNNPVIDTQNLNIPARGLPTEYLYNITASSSATIFPQLATLGVGI